MCIRDRIKIAKDANVRTTVGIDATSTARKTTNRMLRALEDCLLYTSDAADERSSVDLGGRRIIQKKNHRFLVDSSTRYYTELTSWVNSFYFYHTMYRRHRQTVEH